MARQHVQLHDGGIVWQGVFVDTEAGWVGEVVGELAVHLEDVAIVFVAGDGDLGFEWAVGDVCL